MFKRTIGYFLFIATLIAFTVAIQFMNHTIISTKNITINEQKQYDTNILLIPLDSRPPCTQFVQQLGSLDNMKVTLPPQHILDDYKTPANKDALYNWLLTNANSADIAILSADMLVHGSLLASRQSLGTAADKSKFINLLYELHAVNPKLKLYVFNIIPRLLIADSDANAQYQKPMLTYSVLKDQISQFENPRDIKKLNQLENQIPTEIIEKYNSLYLDNLMINTTLINMTEQGILSCLVIGQDDGQPFGMPNLIKKRLQHQIDQKPTLSKKIYITRGTDEVALTMLGHISTSQTSDQPKIFVTYSNPADAQIVMPFMPHSVGVTVDEKIKMMNGILVSSPQEADYILFVHIGTKKNASGQILQRSAETLKEYIDKGYRVAIVDLTEDFYGYETLYPMLKRNQVDLTKLIAYAGWNTTSNSIGTALTQATLFIHANNRVQTIPQKLIMHKENLEFLSARILDDWYYLKDIQPYINTKLRASKIDPYNLNTRHNSTEILINHLMLSRANHFFTQELSNHPITINNNTDKMNIIITDIRLETHLPWDRTFEISLKPTLFFREIIER